MLPYLLFLLYLTLPLFSPTPISLPLTNWTFRIPNRTGWNPAYIPSTVHLDLLSNKLIPDPYFGSNIMDLYWIQTQDVVYNTIFTAPPNILSTTNQFIVFEGLDTHCDVILNNQKILHANNMFRKWKVPVKLKESNNLTVYFYSSVKYDLEQEKKLMEEQGFKLPANYSFSRKAAYQYGWDWGPRLVTAGIWKDVYLEGYNNTYLNNIFVKHQSVTENTTKVALQILLDFKDINLKSNYRIDTSFTEGISEKVSHKIDSLPAPNCTVSYFVDVKNFKLWWTHDVGTPQLYTLTVQIFQNDQPLFNKTQRFGIRTVTVSQVNDTFGTSFTIVLNGKEIFMRGGNYIPVDMFMPRALKNPSVYNQIIESSLFANYNMLRIWGGGQFEFDIFYDKCDEAGLLIWHDLMFACAMYPGGDEIERNIEQEMIDNLIRLRNHPSIALWNGNNEVWIGWLEWGWKSGKTAKQIALIEKWYDRIFRVILPETIARYDYRFYWQTSPSSSSNSLSSINSGDIHFWQVWGAGANIELYSTYTGRFNSEYGMQSMLEYNSILKFTKLQDRTLNSYVMRLHERHIYGDAYLPMYVESYVGVAKNNSLKSFSYLSQLMQSYALKTAIDALRTTSTCMGSLYWQLNDVWPVSSWSTMDYYGAYKAAQYMARDSYQTVYATMVLRNNSYLLYIVNDDIKTISGTMKYTIYDFEGNVLKPMVQKSYFMAAGRRAISEAITKEEMAKKSLTNIYYFGRPSQTQNKPSTLKLNLIGNKLTISADKLARWVYVSRTDGVTMKLKNNYFDILPQSSVTVELPDGLSLSQIEVMEYYTEIYKNPKLLTAQE